jgi:sec-independent protein translocase protein TatA
MGDALAPWHIIILVIVLVLLFGARRLPGAAQSLGQSMHIFKKSVQGLNPDSTPAPWAAPTDQATAANPPEAAALAAAPDATQQQLADLQRQIADLQRQSASVSNGQAGQTQAGQTQTSQTDWSPR